MRKAFALIELMVVMAIISVIASIALPSILRAKRAAYAAKCLANRRIFEQAEAMYYLDRGHPCLNCSELVKLGYQDAELKCPEGGEYVWVPVDSESDMYPTLGCSIHYWTEEPPPPSPSEPLLLSDDFKGGLDKWKTLCGRWALKDGMLTNARWGENRIVTGDPSWTDYTITTVATLQRGKGWGIYFRADGDRRLNGYCAQYDPGYWTGFFLVRKVINGRETRPIARVRIPRGFDIYGQPHTVEIKAEGNHFTMSVDGQKMLDFHDDTFKSGGIGFRTWGRSKVLIDRVEVRGKAGGPKPEPKPIIGPLPPISIKPPVKIPPRPAPVPIKGVKPPVKSVERSPKPTTGLKKPVSPIDFGFVSEKLADMMKSSNERKQQSDKK